ncbi:ferrochelatase [Thalassobaculum fulvum]|uniref:Ferrochelatase n=1 Tax=Thalassobaculum fulvum TaxID=1633335 RepID=A0A918XUH6_9PROT|nr:ferrochelatase [Thalassobaculum fulvum]GHD57189.1 ferrochelatase [Thalassobaculum fulvum]
MSVRTVAAVPGVPDHPTVRLGRIGVLLVNLGTPDSTSIPDIRRYLAEFLSDRRVIDVNPVLWKLILHGVILRTRPPKTAEAYRAIWLAETDESPLRFHTRATAEALQARLDPEAETVRVDWAMRYGNPAIRARMQALQDEGCDRILVLPLYPQYAASTTATVVDEVARHLLDARWQPAVRTVPAFHDDPAYIEAVAAGIETHLGTLDWQPEVILASFHGLPKRYLTLGDPYHCHCAKTARLLRTRLGLDESRLRLTFQSRFGREEWLQPYTDETIETLAQSGVKRLAVVMPGFVADCVETLEEIAIQARETFEEAGGTHFTAIPCLNSGADAVTLYETLVRRELAGWWKAEEVG